MLLLRPEEYSLTADQDKTHQERLITLPPVLVTSLDRLKGGRYLWGRYTEDSAVYRPGKGRAKEFAGRCSCPSGAT